MSNSKFRTILRHSRDRLDYKELYSPFGVRLSERSNLEVGIAAPTFQREIKGISSFAGGGE
jgi:hypothetical protein